MLRPAHVSLAHPWVPPAEAFAALARLDAVAASLAPSPVRFATVARFGPDRRGRTTLHLRPADPGPVVRVAAALGLDPGVPHLSVVRLAADEAVLGRLEASIAARLPVDAVLCTVQLRVRYGTWWRVEHVAHLGGAPSSRAQPRQ